MDIQYFVGVDIAKGTLDWAVFNGKTIVLQTHSANSVTGIKTVLRLLKGLPSWNPKQIIFCMEHTTRWPPEFTMLIYLIFSTGFNYLFGWRVVCRSSERVVYNEGKPPGGPATPLTHNGLRSTPFGFVIECGYGSRPALLFNSWLS